MKNWYKNLKSGFFSFSPSTQILHLVSDLNKAKHFSQSNPQTAANHLYRAIILLDYIIADPKWIAKLSECLRLREVIGSLIDGKQTFATYDQTIDAALLLHPIAYKTFKNIQI